MYMHICMAPFISSRCVGDTGECEEFVYVLKV